VAMFTTRIGRPRATFNGPQVPRFAYGQRLLMSHVQLGGRNRAHHRDPNGKPKVQKREEESYLDKVPFSASYASATS